MLDIDFPCTSDSIIDSSMGTSFIIVIDMSSFAHFTASQAIDCIESATHS